MKKRYFACCLLIASFFLFFTACSDDAGNLGVGVMPDDDEITTQSDTFLLNTSTIVADSVYANNTVFPIGVYEDEQFGAINASLLAQVIYPQQNLKFPDGAEIDSMVLSLHFSRVEPYNGIALDVYEMNNELDFRGKYYSDIDPDAYVDFGNKLGSLSLGTNDTVSARLKLYDDFAARFIEESIYTDEATFKSNFNGLYIMSPTTTGKAMVYADSIDMRLFYHTATDTVSLLFPANNEVRQVTSIKQSGLETVLSNKSPKVEYVVSPAGFFTTMDIPVKKIIEATTLTGKKTGVNHANIEIEVTDTTSAPGYLLLIPKNEMVNFFSTNKVADSKTIVYAGFDKRNKSYTFDLTYYIQTVINDATAGEEIPEVNNMVLVPVAPLFSSSTMTSIKNLMTLSSATIKNRFDEKSPLHLRVIYSQMAGYEGK